jgi:hypothetical protein
MSFRSDFYEDITTMDTIIGAQVKLDIYFKSGSCLTQTPGARHTKLNAQIAFELHLECSTYEWEDKNITYPTPPFTCQKSFGVDGIRQNN